MDTTNRFIQFDGMDGCGKTSIVQKLYDELVKRKQKVMTIRMPGGVVANSEDALPFNDGGELLREFFLSKRKNFHSDSALLISLAAYRENLISHVRPFLDDGGYVLCDRGIASIGAYHNLLLHSNPIPAKTLCGHQDYLLEHQYPSIVYLDVDYATSQQRMGKRGETDSSVLDIKEVAVFDKIRNDMLRMMDQHAIMLNRRFRYNTTHISLEQGELDTFVQEVLMGTLFPEVV